ncbi:MAG: hypothetical protein R3176_10275 [Woeseiaceae bacterium]|nr:hypothetical protein [Woeseiaceae bacterium]
MIDARFALNALVFVILPVIVAGFGLSVWAALGLVVAALAWRWLLNLLDLMRAQAGPEFVLDTILLSHFAEKIRWCMDRLGIDYRERASAGVIGALFTGRTVPRLMLRTGRTRSSIGNSPEILRYLWGAFATPLGEKAAFLEPTQTRLDFERRLERYGVALQVWVYYHILDDRDLALRAWGAGSPLVPWWQRKLLPVVFPLLRIFLRRAFRVSEQQYGRSVEHIETLLGDVDTRLADGRVSILGGAGTDFVDITFAALTGLWLQPDGYGGGKAEACRIARSRMPVGMRRDVERWIEDFPRAVRFAERLYREERPGRTSAPENGPTEQDDDPSGD